jgi:2-succinyl-5-enolpyruvyl-6-hydroxy-3-cyclohexene-1-carboxylate synthase
LGLWITRGREYAEEQEHAVIDQALQIAPDVSGSRSTSWQERKDFLKAELAASRAPISREVLVGTVWKASWPHDRLVFGASRLIRVADKYVPGKKIPVFANRGLAGIDGTISTARGIAAASEGAVTRVLLGDLATVHDSGSLVLTQGEGTPHVQVIVGNDHGGTIFDALEVSESATAENIDRVLLTPVTVDFEKLAEGYGWNYVKVSTVSQLEAALIAPQSLPQLVEVVLER